MNGPVELRPVRGELRGLPEHPSTRHRMVLTMFKDLKRTTSVELQCKVRTAKIPSRTR